MIVTCPTCESQYLLPDDSVTSKGRRVKCTTCAHTWVQMPEGEESGFGAILSRVDTAMDERVEPVYPRAVITPIVKSPSLMRVLVTGLAMAVTALCLSLALFVALREKVVSLWPPSALLFEALHVPVAIPGKDLGIENIKIASNARSKNGELQLSGNFTNKTDSDKTLPGLVVSLNNEKATVKKWSINLFNTRLKAGKTVPFHYTLKDAPQGAQNVTVQFSD